ncbi:hypothetical protein Mal48_47310 [Thalassoglobus polymorphus]|uniref:Uncharacterized protein n=2 Tax=Thalassoglobus polymorphus TaxID=2527994 RepID=A0A517QV19_9PLAN|nr:hypothetical protein Mal48_47310 [Thalassoglobus polymorphus]
MFRPKFVFTFILLAGLVAQGCTNLMARRAIMDFSASLESQDLEQIRVATSSDFGSKALRQPEAISDLKLLRFPKGEVRVISIEAIDEVTKMATVAIGEEDNAKEVDYKLTLDRETGRWVVDDVILSQDDTTGREIRRSVTDQMDLLLSCRELLKDWESAPRSVKLQHCTEELHEHLAKLPPNWFKRLSEDAVGSGRRSTFRPEARLNGDHAVVVAPHQDGSLFVEYRKELNNWKVQNIAIEPKGKGDTGVRSLMTLAKTLNSSAEFLASFAAGDVDQLAETASPAFYKQSLLNADLDSIRLPVEMMIADEYDAKQHKDRTELLLEANGTTYMLTVRTVDLENEDGSPRAAEPRVDEVTIFEANGSDVKKISAMLLSSSVVDLYVEALRTRNLQQIRSMSSNDFNERVWKLEASKHFKIMPYPHIDAGDPEVLSTVFRGDITEITIAQGETPMTFILRLGEGWMTVDDVIMPAHNRPVSLKANLELMLPIHAFASGVNRGDVDEASKYSDSGLDQMIWRQLNYVPDFSKQMVRPLMSEVMRISPNQSWIVVHTSDGTISSEIKMVRRGERYVVHDVSMINEASPTKQFAFLQTARQMIAAGQLLPKGATKAPVIQASRSVQAESLPTQQQQQVAPYTGIPDSRYEQSQSLMGQEFIQSPEPPVTHQDGNRHSSFEPISPDLYAR